MHTKICKKCGIEKDISDFYKSLCVKDGLFSKCKICCLKYNKKRLKKPEIKEKMIKYQAKYFQDVRSAYRRKPEELKKRREYAHRDEIKKKILEYRHRPEVKRKRKKYLQRPEVIERIKKYRREYERIPWVKEKIKKYQAQYRQKNKQK